MGGGARAREASSDGSLRGCPQHALRVRVRVRVRVHCRCGWRRSAASPLGRAFFPIHQERLRALTPSHPPTQVDFVFMRDVACSPPCTYMQPAAHTPGPERAKRPLPPLFASEKRRAFQRVHPLHATSKVKILPRPVLPYRRLRIQGVQGRGGS